MRSTTQNTSSSGGIGLAGATFLVFLVLKLTGYITWSWWWVTAPLWGSVLFALLVVAVLLFVAFFVVKK
jgi:phosphoglycerol transferase MdoB-like AlkP superfamily enzyme